MIVEYPYDGHLALCPTAFWAYLVGTATLGVFASGCSPTEISDGMPSSTSCYTCHGSADNAAPPKAVNGSSETSDIGVGAHQAHLSGGSFSKPVECEACHVVPARVEDPGHNTNPPSTEVVFSGIAAESNASPQWDKSSATCAGNYCHMSDQAGGMHSLAVWTSAGHGEATCGTCHGLPPPLPHPEGDDCAMCHPTVVDATMKIIAKQLHVNGKVEM